MSDIYIYIDESGDLTPINKGGKSVFIIGCIITNNAVEINTKIGKLKTEILNSSYHFRHKKDFKKKGFHASTNHVDIYTKFVPILNTLNFRSYFVLIDKETSKFSDMMEREENVYYFLLKKLLKDRLLKFKDENINIIMEQSTTKKTIENESVSLMLEEINKNLLEEGLISEPIKITCKIQGKNEDTGVDVIDYLNHIIYTAKVGGKKGKKYNYQTENLKLIEPKIALISDLMNSKYFEGRKETSSISDFLNYV